MAPRRVADNLPDRPAGRLGVSRILATLGPEWFAPFPAVHTPGRVVWCNFELARQLGFAVPSSNRMTLGFHQQLIEALSYRAVAADRPAAPGRATLTLYADRYGGEGLGPGLGAGRAGFLPVGNLYIKGVGLTPLFKHNDPRDYRNRHGGLQMNHCVSEAVFGEVNHHLFTHGSTRLLAIIDQGAHVVYPDRKVAVVLGIRSGTQLRPGHLLTRQVRRRRSILEAFIRMTTETKQLSARRDAARGGRIADVKKTMIRVVDDHARAVAERFRWRMTHGAVTSSNMDMSGATLDLTTQSAQPRTAPVCFRHDYASFFGLEHLDCAAELKAVYQVLVNSIARRERPRLNARPIDFAGEMTRAYGDHLQTQLLGATGVKPEVVQRIRAEHADLAGRFTAIISTMCELRNPGSVEMARKVVDRVSVLDVFNLLREFPRCYFADPRGSHVRFIRRALKPVFRGNRYQIASNRAAVSTLIKQWDETYRELMRVCAMYARDYYGGAAGMRASITARAAFENEPIRLYRSALYKELQQVIETYSFTGDVELVRGMVERYVSTSLRRVDALLVQGATRRLRDGGFEVGMRTIDGIDYAVRAWRGRRRRLRVSVPVERRGRYFEVQLPGWPPVTRQQLQSARYRFTTDGWMNTRTREAHLFKHADGRWALVCESIPAVPTIGRLEGVFDRARSRGSKPVPTGAPSTAYTYAVPDQQELAKLMGQPWRPRTR